MTPEGFKGLMCAVALTVCGSGSLAVARSQQATRPATWPVTSLEGPAASTAAPDAQPRRPAAVSLLPVTRLDDRAAMQLDGARTVSLSLAQPMPLGDLLVLLVRGTPFSVVADAAVAGAFTGELKDLTMREALEAVLFPRGLDYDLQGTIIRVFPQKTTTRVYAIDYLNVTRTSSTAVGTSGRAVTGSVEADRFEAIAKGVNALLSNSGRAQVDRIAGVIQVTDFAERLDRVAVYLEAVQLRATRQVRLEARVFEVRLANRAPAWVDWNAIAAKAGGGFSRRSAGITVTDPDALVRAVAELGAVTMIAAPQLVAMNNEPAIVRAGTAVTLSVLAQIAADGVVQLHVVPSVADRAVGTGSTTGEAGPAPGIGEADTVVRLKDGETFVLAGILRREMPTQREAGASSPVVAQNMEAGTSELVVLLTPTIVGPAIDIRGQH